MNFCAAFASIKYLDLTDEAFRQPQSQVDRRQIVALNGSPSFQKSVCFAVNIGHSMDLPRLVVLSALPSFKAELLIGVDECRLLDVAVQKQNDARTSAMGREAAKDNRDGNRYKIDAS